MLRKVMLCFVLAAVAALFVAPATQAETMLASWYGPGLWGNQTASGEVLYYGSHYAASPYLPIGTELYVCYLGCTTVWVMDRGPYVGGRQLDLEQSAAEEIGLIGPGVDYVTVY